MQSEREILDVGRQVGNEAADHIGKRAEVYCEHERQRIELSNEARINALQAEGYRLAKLERQLEERMRLAPPPGDTLSRKRKAYFYWFIGTLLTVAAFFFSLVAFGPYRLGWYGDLYCLGVAVATPFAIEVFLDAWKSKKLLKALVTIVFLAAIGGGALLAAIRGDLLSHEVQQSAPAIVIDGYAPAAPHAQNSFYDSTHGSLRMLMLLLALAIDLGAGVAIHLALFLGTSSREDFVKLSRDLSEVREQLTTIVHEITALTNAPAIFVARFWRDFYRAMLTQTVWQAATKVLGLALCLLFLGSGGAFGQERLNLVVAVDLTASEAVKGHDGQSQFSKNIQGVTRLLGTVPAGSKVTIIGITENSFGQPYVLLSATVSDDEGYFGERLTAGRQQLVSAWQKRSAQLEPKARKSDVLGAMLVASALFEEAPDRQRKMLVIYSDMRHVTSELDLESSGIVRVDGALAVTERHRLLADLKAVDVFVVGANAVGKSVAQWQSVEQFWRRYFDETGAVLSEYSALCEVPNL
jgi:hypothetical protein